MRVIYIHLESKKSRHQTLVHIFGQILTDFQNSSTGTFYGKFAIFGDSFLNHGVVLLWLLITGTWYTRVCIAEETHERCDGCGQTLAVLRSVSAELRPTRCPECISQTSATTPSARRAPAGDSFSIHSLVGDTTVQRPSSTSATCQQSTNRPKLVKPSSNSSSPFLVQAAAAHAQYYALAASGLLPALNYGGRSTRVSAMPLEWSSSTGLSSKHRYGV